MKTNLKTLIAEEMHIGNIIQMPLSSENNTVIVLNKEDIHSKFFLVFDVRRNCFIRRI